MTWAELKEGHGEGPLCVTSGGTGLDIRRRSGSNLPLQVFRQLDNVWVPAPAPDGFTELLPIRQVLAGSSFTGLRSMACLPRCWIGFSAELWVFSKSLDDNRGVGELHRTTLSDGVRPHVLAIWLQLVGCEMAGSNSSSAGSIVSTELIRRGGENL